MNKILALLTSIILSMSAQAQQKSFTLEDLNFGGTNYRNLTVRNRWTAWWGDELVRLHVDKCGLIDKTSGKEKTLFTLKDINQWIGSGADDGLRSLYHAQFPYAGKHLVLVEGDATKLLVDFKAHKVVFRQSITNENNADWSPVSKFTAYTELGGYNLFVRSSKENDGVKDMQLSNDGSRNILYGTSVHRDEFGYSKGTFWSPDGTKLAFTRMDQTQVNDYPLVDYLENDWTPAPGESRSAKYAPEKYPMAGETSHKVTIGVYDTNSQRTIYLKAGDPTNRYFTNPAWSPDSKTVYLFELNRDQNDCRLVSYDATTGEKLAELYRETDAKYVEPTSPIVFLPWDKNLFIMQSQKDGYNHLYLMDTRGKLIKQVTSGAWVVMDFLGFNAKKHAIIYSSNEASPLQRNTWMVNVDNGKRTLLDNGKGWHNAQLSASGTFLVDNYSEPTVPRRIEIIDINKLKRTDYFTAPNPWKDYRVPEYSCGTIKAADGTTDLYYRMVKPINFNPEKKYPTVVYVYGGPHAHNVDARWHYGSRSWETYMAQKGYLLFILDNRGSENRGRAFEQATFRQLGQEEMKDQMKGVEFLKSLPYVDADRLGVHGWSFGGFMTISLMTNYPDVFKVGVAGGPVIDWKWYEAMYGERYMDTPEANPEGYAKTSLLKQAKNLKGKLQVITGENDPVVVPQHAKAFIHQCILDGTQPDFFMYPGEPHNMRGHQSTHLHERITQYFEDYLK